MRANLWTVIGSIATVLAVFVTVFLFIQGRSDQSKKLEIGLTARSTLVDESVHVKQRIEILYDGQKIPNYVILQLRVVNTGGQPIRGTDYEEHFTLHFDNVTKVLSAEQVSSDPKQLQISPQVCSPDCQSVWLPPALLNPRDWYILEVGVIPESGKKPMIEIKGRIAGVKQIDFRDSLVLPTKEIFFDWTLFSYTSLIVFVLTILLIFTLLFFSKKFMYVDIENFMITCINDSPIKSGTRFKFLRYLNYDSFF